MQKVRVFHPIGRAEVTKMINKDFKKYNMTEEIIDDILEIAAYRFHVSLLRSIIYGLWLVVRGQVTEIKATD